MSMPAYRVQVFEFADAVSYGIGDQIAEFANPLNVGWAVHLNDVPQLFFTINQEDPQLQLVQGYEGKAHVRVYRDSDIVFAGLFGLEHDATRNDVVLYAYGYLAGLFWLLSDFRQEWTAQTVGTIVTDAWTRAKTTLTQTNVRFVTTGTIESPVTTSGGATPLSLPYYVAFRKRILFLLQEMAAISISDTTNAVVFEITHSVTPTFNFWKNRGSAVTNTRFELGGNVLNFRERKAPVWTRNHLYTIGSSPQGVLLNDEESNAPSIDAYGRRQEPLFFAWVRDATELDRASKLRLALALRDEQRVALHVTPGTISPPGASDASYKLSDTVPVKISRGITSIDSALQVTGTEVLWLRGGTEFVHPIVATKAGT